MQTRSHFNPPSRDLWCVESMCLLIRVRGRRNTPHGVAILVQHLQRLHLAVWCLLVGVGGCRGVLGFVWFIVRCYTWLVAPETPRQISSWRVRWRHKRHEWCRCHRCATPSCPRMRQAWTSRSACWQTLASNRSSCSCWHPSTWRLSFSSRSRAPFFKSLESPTWFDAIIFNNLHCSAMVSLWPFNSSSIPLETSIIW